MVNFTLMWISSQLQNTRNVGVPTVVQWDQQHLWSPGMKVGALAQHSQLRIWHCHSFSLGQNCGSDLIPGLRTPYATGWPKKKKKKMLIHGSWMELSPRHKPEKQDAGQHRKKVTVCVDEWVRTHVYGSRKKVLGCLGQEVITSLMVIMQNASRLAPNLTADPC